MLTAVILAAGGGSRMNSAIPQVMHQVCGKPQLSHVAEAAKEAGASRIIIVAGPWASGAYHLPESAEVIIQQAPEGTASALKCALPLLAGSKGRVLVLFGNMPLLSACSLGRLASAAGGVVELAPAAGDFGCPSVRGAFCIDVHLLEESAFSGCAELCDVMGNIALKAGSLVVEAQPGEYFSVSDRAALWRATEAMRRTINLQHMANGVTILEPQSTLIDAGVVLGRDVTIYPGCMLLGSTRVGQGSTLFSTRLADTAVGERCVLQNVVANRAVVGNDVTIGPFVNLRPDTVIKDGCKIGDFVEVKNSNIGEKTKMPHLSYIGDADVGERVNVGCGCVFVNYDGFKKHRTVVGNDVFLGCQTNLVAPVSVGDDAYTAAGSTITEDIPAGAFAIARSRQQNKPGWVERIRALKQKQ